MGAGGASGSDAGFANTQKSKLTKTNQEIVDSNFRDRGANKIKKGIKTPSIAINVLGTVLSKPLQAGSRITRDYFKSEVLGKGAYKGTDVTSFESMSRAAQENLYSDYIGGRTSGRTDAYGRKITSTNKKSGGAIGTSGQVVQAPKPVTSPTTAEVSQSAAAQAQENITLRKRRILSKGRSPTIITGVTGATGSLTLGKPSLLGR